MKEKLIWFLIITMLAVILSTPLAVYAQGDIEVSVKAKGARLEYKLKNKTNDDIETIQIDEVLKDSSGNVVDSSSINSGWLAAGANVDINGKSYDNFTGSFSVKYDVRYKLPGNPDMQDLVSDEQKLNLKVKPSDIRISVSYSAEPADNVLKGSSVKYTAELESKSDMPIYNIIVIDSVHGELGRIDVLEPQQKRAVSKSFNLSESTESYIILKFNDPFNQDGQIEQPLYNTKLNVNVKRIAPEPKIVMSVKPNKSAIDGARDVTFNIDITNTGNVALTNIKLTDWNGKAFAQRDRLEPGGSYSESFTRKIEPDKVYKISCTASAEGTDKGIGTFYEVKLANAKASVEIDRKITPDSFKIGDSITLEYIIRNNGNVALRDIKLEEPEWKGRSLVGQLDNLEPGEEKTQSVRIDLTAPMVSKVVLTGYNKVTGEEYKYEAVGLSIGGSGADSDSKIEIDLRAEPERLEEPGSVKLECVIKNRGSDSLKNVEVSLEDSEFILGSFVELPGGSEETIKSTSIDIEETTTFKVVVKGINSAGNRVEYTSSPLTVEVGDGKDAEDDIDGKRAILKTVMVVLTLLIIFVAGTLIYTIKNPKAGSKIGISKRKGNANKKGRRGKH